MWKDYTVQELNQMPTESGHSKFVLIDGKWHVKGRSQDLQGKGPFNFYKRDYQKVTFDKSQLKFVKRYLAKHPKTSRQASHYVCKYDLYEIVRENK